MQTARPGFRTGRWRGALEGSAAHRLELAADRAELVADLAAQEDEGDDRDDRDEGEDQRVLREALAFLVLAEGSDECVKHGDGSSFLLKLPGIPEGGRHLTVRLSACQYAERPSV